MKFDHLDKTKDLAHAFSETLARRTAFGGLKAHKALMAHTFFRSLHGPSRLAPNPLWGQGHESKAGKKSRGVNQRNLRPAGTDARTLAAEAPHASARSQPSYSKTHKSLGTPSPYPSTIMRSPGSAPYQDRRHQVYPEPQVEPPMRMNKDQDQHPGKKSPQHSTPRLRDKKPPHMDPSDKQRKPGKKQA
jgi:hypothetical protein